MNTNVGSSESKLRIIVGLVLLVAGFIAPVPDMWHVVGIDLGIASMFTAMGFCPLKALLFRGRGVPA